MSRRVRTHAEPSAEALTFSDDSWSTTYEVSAAKVWMLLKDLAAVSDWAVIEFHPTGIVGRALDDTHVSMARAAISENSIESTGTHCEVGVNVGAVGEFDAGFLASGLNVEVELDRNAETITLDESMAIETVDLKAATQTRSQDWIDAELGTTARMKGWEFAGAVDGACGATDLGFVVEAGLNDLNLASRGTPWATTIEDVVTETAFDTAGFGTWFWPEITERVHTENDVEVRFGQDKPIVVQIEDRVKYAVAPRIIPDDEENGGDSA